jgi:hypothetical protein
MPPIKLPSGMSSAVDSVNPPMTNAMARPGVREA